jgi:DNA-binding NarL/FixJ family response regulator
MPILNGIETMSWIKKNMPKLDVIALSVNDDEKVVLKMVKMGVKGYLLKDCEPETFIEALNIVYKKGFFYSDKISKYIFESILKPKKNLFNDKELDFIKYSCSELTYKEIAEKMCVSFKTVDNYRESVFDRLNVKTRIGVVIYATKNKLI